MKILLLVIVSLNLVVALSIGNISTKSTDDLGDFSSSPKLNLISINNNSVLDSQDKQPSLRKEGRSQTNKRETSQDILQSKKSTPREEIPKAKLQDKKPETVASLDRSTLKSETATDATDSLVACVSLGPFMDKSDARELYEKLIVANVDSQIKNIKEKEQFRVYVEAQTPGESPNATTQILRKHSIRKFDVSIQTNKKFMVSLGWFDSADAAANQMKKLRGIGLTPKTEVKGSQGEQVWLTYNVPRGKKLPQEAEKAIQHSRGETHLSQKHCNN